ncbi:phosphatase PAP2 family protein [Sulfitobacter sp. THAF37]|uniref:phosphatase PAP2 family protein n=1 Tax=Sulfitobacter sp. THAF37 TaxID=2587855 RepID=UPI001561C36C|nr:phosphatase PAP2 family protein [Sulfitobacter sp. THAF37]
MTDARIIEQSGSFPAPLRNGEIKYLSLGLAAFVAVVVLSFWRSQAIDWMSFLNIYGAALGLLGIGIYLRACKNAERFACITVALAGYALFGVSMGIVFHIYMPRPEPVLDEFLLGFDHYFGYHWPDAVAWLAREHAWLGRVLSHIYLSSFAQLILVIVLLGATGRASRLDMLLLTGMIGLFLTFVVWQIFPNFSMGIHYPIPAEAEQAIRLVTNTSYGQALKEAALNGIPVISNETMQGVVAFPSYHTVMACLTVWFAFRTVAFWPIVILNIAMIPAIHIHGAHHILDFVGGVFVFFAALYLAGLFLNSGRR